MRVRFTEVSGTLTRYYDAGQGPTLLLAHGVRMTADGWLRNIDTLARSHRVIAPDLTGCGFTPESPTASKKPLNGMAAHLIELLDTLQLGTVAALGSSLGGAIVANAYVRNPERFHALVFVCCEVLLNGDSSVRRAIGTASNTNASKAYDLPSLQTINETLTRIVTDADTIPEAVALLQLTSTALPGSAAAYARRSQSLTDGESGFLVGPELGERLRHLDTPVLGIWGAEDPRGDPIARDTIAASMPKARFVTMSGVGHLPYLERPTEFNAIVTDFLSDVAPRSDETEEHR